MKMSVVRLCVVCYAIGLYSSGIVSAQDAEPPISNDACEAVKMIAEGTTSGIPALIAVCTVQPGCAKLQCNTQDSGYANLTFHPCSMPPSIYVSMYNTNDELTFNQSLTPRTAPYVIPLGSKTLTFTIQQTVDGISIKVDASTSTIPGIEYVPTTELDVDEALCTAGNNSITPGNISAATTTTIMSTQQQPTTTAAMITPSTSSPQSGAATMSRSTSAISSAFATSTPFSSPASGCSNMSATILLILTVCGLSLYIHV